MPIPIPVLLEHNLFLFVFPDDISDMMQMCFVKQLYWWMFLDKHFVGGLAPPLEVFVKGLAFAVCGLQHSISFKWKVVFCSSFKKGQYNIYQHFK